LGDFLVEVAGNWYFVSVRNGENWGFLGYLMFGARRGRLRVFHIWKITFKQLNSQTEK
jgi:hypothetical protein